MLSNKIDNGEKKQHGKYKISLVSAVIIIILLVAIYSYDEIIPKHITPSTVTTTTITVTTIPAAVNSTSLLNSLSNKSNSLYRINSSQNYSMYFNEQPGYNSVYKYVENYSVAGINYSYARIYGLNFTQYVINNMLVLPVNYTLSIPKAYQNYTQPMIVEVSITTFSNASYLENSINSFSNNKNGTLQVPIMPFSINNTCPCINQTFNYTRISVDGIPLVMQTISPWYTSLEMNQIFVPYKNIQINVVAYGLIGKYNQSYTVSIAKQILETLESKIK